MIIQKIMLSGKKHYSFALAISGLFFLSACTAGSMRVDIEVYKGPLSKTTDIQIGELKGYVADTSVGLTNFVSFGDKCDDPKEPKDDKFKFGSCHNFFSSLEELEEKFETLKNKWGSSEGFLSPANYLTRTLKRISLDIENYESHRSAGKTRLEAEANRLAAEKDRLEAEANRLAAEKGRADVDRERLDFNNKRLKEDREKLVYFTSQFIANKDKFAAELSRLDNERPINTISLLDKLYELARSLNGNSDGHQLFINRTYEMFEKTFSSKRSFLKLSELSEDQKSLIKTEALEFARFDQEFLNDLLESTATLATRLHSSSFYWSTYVNFRNLEGYDRFFITEYTAMASEYSNQISSRTDALQKQLIGDSKSNYKNGRGPINKEDLPLSAYLRDTRPTDFTELYHWQESSGKLGSNPNNYSDNDIEIRINAFKHIFDDHFWSNINTVYASGGGDAHMAFVKDEIGNWTLKSFESDPTELVQAYKKLTLAAITAASKAAVASGTGGVSPDMLATIGKLMSGRTRQAIDPATQVKIDALKKQTIKDLEGLKSQTDSSATIIKGKQILKDYENKLKVLQGS